MNKTEASAKEWLIREKGLLASNIMKTNGTPDFVTPIGGFEVKKLYGDKVIFYSKQIEQLQRYPGVVVLVFNGNGELIKEAPFSEMKDGVFGEIKVVETNQSSIQVSQELKEILAKLAEKKGDTYEVIIRRLLNGKGEADGAKAR